MTTSEDTLLQGRLFLEQPARGAGYRFNLDSVLLSGFTLTNPDGHILDLGAGCGVIGLMLLLSGKVARVTAVEIQPELARLARKNAQKNGFSEREFSLLEGDLRRLDLPEVDGVVFNPPYFRPDQGQPSKCVGRDLARHERNGGLEDFVSVGASQLRPGGRLSAIVPLARSEDLIKACQDSGLGKTKVRWVRPRIHGERRQLLLEAQTSVKLEHCEMEDLIVHEQTGPSFTEEVTRWLEGGEWKD